MPSDMATDTDAIVRAQAELRFHNDRLEQLARPAEGADKLDLLWIRCECGRPTCSDSLEIRHGEYEALRLDPRRFAVAPGHGVEGVEVVIVTSTGRFDVVETIGDAARIAA